jgi:exodeoxyribonuclease VII large subunit
MYTALKDQDAVIDAVCWRGTLGRLAIKPAEGLEVIVTGRITTYPARSNYQLIIEHMELAGIGAILKMIEDRRVRLAAEGLFDPGRKKPLPTLPQTIGVITSPTGAVIRDILHRLADRFPVRVLVYPVAVQGDTAATEVIRALGVMNTLPVLSPHDSARATTPHRPDVIIVARGGGSIEDLMPFNDEGLVRAVAASNLPVISAVGHETDTTLIDYAADRRAPTPTAAAEFAVPVRDDLWATLQTLAGQLAQAARRPLREGGAHLIGLARALAKPEQMLALPRQRLDHADISLTRLRDRTIERAHERTRAAAGRLRHPALLVVDKQRLLDLHTAALVRAGIRTTDLAARALAQADRILETLSFRATLRRGFALVCNPQGSIITNGTDLATGQDITLEWGQGDKRHARITR